MKTIEKILFTAYLMQCAIICIIGSVYMAGERQVIEFPQLMDQYIQVALLWSLIPVSLSVACTMYLPHTNTALSKSFFVRTLHNLCFLYPVLSVLNFCTLLLYIGKNALDFAIVGSILNWIVATVLFFCLIDVPRTTSSSALDAEV